MRTPSGQPNWSETTREGKYEPLGEVRLGAYLNHHLAGANTSVRIVRRAAEENQGNDYGAALGALLGELDEECSLLRRLLSSLEVPEDPLKKLAAWVLERAETLKRNGSQRRPLHRLLELETLLLEATARRCLWQTLELVATHEPRLPAVEFSSLQERAGRRISKLAQLRLDARMPVFTESQDEQGARRVRVDAFPARSYLGPERRTGQDRRGAHVFSAVSVERRRGTERRRSDFNSPMAREN